MSTRRSLLCLAAVGAAVGLAAPATALAGPPPPHSLVLYKAEQQVDLNPSQSKPASVSCNPGDYAVDGMWRVDSVDQPNPQIAGANKTERDIVVRSSRSTAAGTYGFEFSNPSTAQRAQLKIFVTCLGQKTAPDTHQHAFALSGLRTQSFGPVGPGTGFGFHASPADDCPIGTIAVAPGYRINTGSGRVVASRTSLYGGEPPQLRNWSWAFVFAAPANAWTTTYRCLTLKSSTVLGHSHSIVPRFSPSPAMTPNVLAPGSTTEIQESCGEQEKGMVHAFDTTGPSAPHLWFGGMDPRVKTRAYRFGADNGGPVNVFTGVLCFADRAT